MIDSATDISWELRVSRRARYAKLQIKPYGGLEVVIPPRFPRREVPRLVEKHAAWIRRQLAKQSALCESIQLPHYINLAFDQSSTRVYYAGENFPAEGEAHLYIDACDYHTRVKLLRAWLRKKAWSYFPALLQGVAVRSGLSYCKLSIRSQKSRWGSCSIRANISLNDQLLFLPQQSTEYLMVHELCHTRYLNHSRTFWDLVEIHCPDYRYQERVLNQARQVVPQWFLRDLYR